MVYRSLIAVALALLAGTSLAQVDVQDGGASSAAATSRSQTATSLDQQEKQAQREQEREARRARREQRKHMTPEERRQLRNDVDNAGREIYRKPPKS